MPDEYLQKHVVGAPVTGLSLIRSAMTGVVNPTTLSATVNWTFVFKNRTYQKQEARAEIGLPEGAVISQMTVWPGGEPTNARFNASGLAASTVQSPVVAGHDAPAIVTDLGRGRTLLHCYPVPAQGEMKVRVAVVVPLKLHTLTEASVSLPRFIDNNFAISADNTMSIRSPEKLTMNVKGVRSSVSATGEKVLTGVIKEEDLSGSGLSIRVARNATLGPNVIKDPFVIWRIKLPTFWRAILQKMANYFAFSNPVWLLSSGNCNLIRQTLPNNSPSHTTQGGKVRLIEA